MKILSRCDLIKNIRQICICVVLQNSHLFLRVEKFWVGVVEDDVKLRSENNFSKPAMRWQSDAQVISCSHLLCHISSSTPDGATRWRRQLRCSPYCTCRDWNTAEQVSTMCTCFHYHPNKRTHARHASNISHAHALLQNKTVDKKSNIIYFILILLYLVETN